MLKYKVFNHGHVKYEFICSRPVDLDTIMTFNQDQPVVLFLQTPNPDAAENWLKVSLDSQNGDFKDEWSIVASIGRPLADLRYWYEDESSISSTALAYAEVTFANEYSHHIAYFYVMYTDIDFHSPFGGYLYNHKYYLMKDDERIYLYNSIIDINEYNLSGVAETDVVVDSSVWLFGLTE